MKKLFTEAEKQKIADAVAAAEKNTTGEIVPMVIKQSDLYPAAHFRLAIFVALTVSMAMYYLPLEFDPIWYLWAQMPGLLLGYFLAYNSKLKRFFSTKAELDEEVNQKAIQSFFMNELHHTKDRTGVLIMVSLLERRVEILADSGINQVVEKDTWKKLLKPLLKSIKQNQICDGMVTAVHEVGSILSQHFPGEKGDQNELPNDVMTEQ